VRLTNAAGASLSTRDVDVRSLYLRRRLCCSTQHPGSFYACSRLLYSKETAPFVSSSLPCSTIRGSEQGRLGTRLQGYSLVLLSSQGAYRYITLAIYSIRRPTFSEP